MQNKKVLIIDTVHPILIEIMEHNNYSCTHIPNLKLDILSSIISQYHGLIIRSKTKIHKDLINLASNLIFIGRLGSGMENIDFKYAESKGISCFNSPEGNRDAVAEHAMGMLLSLNNNLIQSNNEVKNGIWQREINRGIELKGKTVGIIGYGNTGQSFAQKLSGFGTSVLAYDKYKTNFSDNYAKESTLDNLFTKSDILSLHIPLTEETKNLITELFISKFKKQIYLINTSRGKIVNTKELVKLIKSGKIAGAALDVLEYEAITFENLHKESLPIEFKYLCESKNVILSPHIAGWTHESNIKIAEILAKKIVLFFNNDF